MPVIGVIHAVTRLGARSIRALGATLAPGRWISSCIVPAALALTTFIVFLPALKVGFVNWDDDINFLNNGNYRGPAPVDVHHIPHGPLYPFDLDDLWSR